MLMDGRTDDGWADDGVTGILLAHPCNEPSVQVS